MFLGRHPRLAHLVLAVVLPVTAFLSADALTLSLGDRAGAASHGPRVVIHSARPTRPNVLVFVADDQSQGTVTPLVMPNVYSTMVGGGRSYPNFTVSDPLCCPSRSVIMTGRYNHNNQVHSNDPITALRVDQLSMIQCYLHQAGYSTGLYGKYLNPYPLSRSIPCMTDYAKNPGQAHVHLPFNVNGRIVTPDGYTDDYSLARAMRFLGTTERHDAKPWYVYFASTYPHSPYTPRPEYAHADLSAPSPRGDRPALTDHKSTSKMPVLARHLGAPNPRQTMENQLRMLRTVDDEFGALINKLETDHELDDTIIVYISDNGYLFGEHGLWGKALPYTQAIDVPFMLRFPGRVEGGSSDPRFAQNVDIVPTLLRAVHVHPQLRHPLDGHNLLSRSWLRPYSFHEQWRVPRPDPQEIDYGWQPSWRALRTTRYEYIEWYTDDMKRVTFREYYDLIADPGMNDNLLADHDRSNDTDVQRLHRELLAEARCRGTAGRSACA